MSDAPKQNDPICISETWLLVVESGETRRTTGLFRFKSVDLIILVKW